MSWTMLPRDLHERLMAEEIAHTEVLAILQREPLNLPALRMALLVLSTKAEKAAQEIVGVVHEPA